MDDRWRIEDRDDTISQPDADSWNNFIASLNPEALERERMRPPADVRLERPDGKEDVRMRHWHDEQRRRFHRDLAHQEVRHG